MNHTHTKDCPTCDFDRAVSSLVISHSVNISPEQACKILMLNIARIAIIHMEDGNSLEGLHDWAEVAHILALEEVENYRKANERKI